MTGDGLPRRRLGHTSLEVTPVCVGGAPLGSMPETFGYQVPREQAIATVRRALHGPVNFLDTANCYGEGRSEERIGAALRDEGGLPSGFVLATKVDPDPVTGRFDAARARESTSESLRRLGLDHLQLLYLHDPEDIPFADATGPGGVVEGLLALRDEGVARHLGVAGGPVELMRRYLGTGVFDVVLTHNRFTLVDCCAAKLITEAAAAGIGVVNAAPFGGGILARGTSATQHYGYRRAPDEVLRRIQAMEEACRGFGVPLRAAALHFSTRDPRVTSTVVGATTAAHVDELMALVATVIPAELEQRLAELAALPEDWLW